MIRPLILLTLAVVVTAGAGIGLAAIAGWNLHLPAMLAACGVALLASIAGAACLQLARGATQAGMAQAGLVATMAHLMLCCIAAAVVALGRMELGTPFLFWLMAFYWMTLIALVIVAAKAVKAAPISIATPAQQEQ